MPDAENVIFLVGAKFGRHGNEHATWATNTYLPGRVAQRYRDSRIVAQSTGNVYPMVDTGSGGAIESDPVGPVGEYAMSCLGRERVFTHMAREYGTPLALIQLNYAVEMRFGILVDLGRQILAGEPVDVTTGHVNTVSQAFANEVILRLLRHASSPELVLNLTSPEALSVRRLAGKLGAVLERDVSFTGEEAESALLADASRCHALFGYPTRSLDELIADVAALTENLTFDERRQRALVRYYVAARRIRRVHPRHPRGAPTAGPARGYLVSGPARAALAWAARAARPDLGRLSPAARRRLRRGTPRRLARVTRRPIRTTTADSPREHEVTDP